MNGKELVIAGLANIDRAIEHGAVTEAQLIGILVGEAELGSQTARLLLLAHQHALSAVNEAEQIARGEAIKG